MQKIKETITNFSDAIILLEQLDNPEYLEANGIAPEEIEDIKKNVIEEMVKPNQKQAEEYIEYKLNQRRDLVMFNIWYSEEIKRLTEMEKHWDAQIEKIDKWIDYLLKLFHIDKMKTQFNDLSYRKSEAVVIDNEEIIPAEFKKEKITVSIDKAELKKYLKEWNVIEWARIEERQNLQIK